MYQLVPITNGLLDIDYQDMTQGKTISATQAIVSLRDSAPIRATWQSQTVDQWHSAFNTGTISASKTTITANGTDAALVTATLPANLTQVTFYYADTNQPISTVSVDPNNHTASVNITSTTPKVIPVRVGEALSTQENQIVIVAQ